MHVVTVFLFLLLLLHTVCIITVTQACPSACSPRIFARTPPALDSVPPLLP